MTTPPLGFDGAVLCGGASRRMGTDKALVEVDGRAMAARVAGALDAAGASSVVAVGGDEQALRSLGLTVVSDRWPGEGPLGGLVSALDAPGREPLVVVLGCDLVRPSASEVHRLVGRSVGGDADAVIPRVGERAQWLHGVWRRRVARVLEDVFASGERSLFAAVSGLEVDFVEVDDAGPYADADTPSDLPRGG